MKHKTWILLFAILAVFLPELALAKTVINPPGGGNAWDLIVFGNANVIAEIMTGIKLIMVPDAGGGAFLNLLLFIAVTGFVILAVGAGFDAGKNFFKLFGYIITVWMIWFSTTQLVCNVIITDKLNTTDVTKGPPVVTGVPAIVVLPAAIVSAVGDYFTRAVETSFSTPSDFKLASGAGQFNLFAKVLTDSNKYVFTDSGLKSSLQAYTTDCVIPAISLGTLRGDRTVIDASGQKSTTPVSGLDALTSANDYMAVLGTAKHKSIMTRYYPMASADNTWVTSLFTGAVAQDIASQFSNKSNPDDPTGVKKARGMGVVVPCEDAYLAMEKNVKEHAQELFNASSYQWSKTGTQTPYAQVFQSMLTSAAATSYASPSSYIMQQGLINSSQDNFKAAAMQAGNNNLMQAAAIAQAEAQQVSTWVTGFQMFNNMMGYVYIVLQSFIFGIMPFVIVALLIPGIGRKIFSNYMEILVWLALWMPMLAIINFIITSFAIDGARDLVNASEGGVTLGNQAIVNERTKMLMVAAQFLGTMSPLISWGVVKGALAFTEFISHGVGSQFAAQAGTQAATGNMSLNNMSMGNVSNDKFSTQMSSAVGYGGVQAGTNAGSVLTKHDAGGSAASNAGAGVDLKQQVSSALSAEIGKSEAVSKLLSSAFSKSSSDSEALGIIKSHTNSAERGAALDLVANQMRQQGAQESYVQQKVYDKSASTGTSANQTDNTQFGVNAGGNLPIPGVNIGASTSTSRSGGVAKTGQQLENASAKESGDKSLSVGTANAAGTSGKISRSESEMDALMNQRRSEKQTTDQSMVQSALSRNESYTKALKDQQQAVSSTSFSRSVDREEANLAIQQAISTAQSLANQTSGLGAQYNAMDKAVTADEKARTAGINNMEKSMGPAPTANDIPHNGARKDAGGLVNSTSQTIEQGATAVHTGNANIEQQGQRLNQNSGAFHNQQATNMGRLYDMLPTEGQVVDTAASGLSAAGSAVSTGANAVGGAVSAGANAVNDALPDLPKSENRGVGATTVPVYTENASPPVKTSGVAGAPLMNPATRADGKPW